ncbi:MAG: hypothetical protein GWN14_15460 [candidate division Zixibacteria bacterium]|nr:hypothetical protein [Gammaproteobacteria bacterium]NIX57279.1 hypothetical protein [candidate division Zixibacteria bacterium]
MKIWGVVAALCMMLFFISACGPSEADLAETDAVIMNTSDAQSTNTMSVQHTSAAKTEQFLKTQDYLETQAAATSQASTATEAFQATETSVIATAKANAMNTQVAKTETAIAQATEEASDIYQIVQALYDEGYITRKKGSFQQLPHYDATWAQIGYFYIDPIRNSFVTDFVLVVDVSWEASDRATEFYRAGCGIAFRVTEDRSEFYNFMLSLDGQMTFFPKLASLNWVRFSKTYWGDIDHMEGSTTFIITAEGINFQVFNADLERIDMRNGAELESGNLAYQISSGSNKGFGTHCVFSDTELWRFED